MIIHRSNDRACFFHFIERRLRRFYLGAKKLRKEQYMAQKNGMWRSARPMLYRRKINEIKSYYLKFHNAKLYSILAKMC